MARLAVVIALLLAFVACEPQPAPLAQGSAAEELAPEAPNFRSTVEQHVAAISKRDFDGILATITESDSLTLIFPDGTLLRSRDAYISFHQEWFADSTWTMDIDLVRLHEASGTALVRTAYEDDGPSSRREAWLVLSFARENGFWRLVHDQNTRIPADD